ncbi:MAG: DUF3800 domain-containing protein, partial [Treponema sp.]|nr:DUF3800 domain-containing protein [Treponema sp.]
RAGRETQVHLPARKFLAFFLWSFALKELSIFIDESGDFGDYSFHSPYYIITMVFHNQTEDIQMQIKHLDMELSYLGLNNLCIHTGPIIRKEEVYKEMDVFERRRIFNKMMAFIRSIDIQYKSFFIEKKHMEDAVEATGKLSKQISQFIRDHYDDFLSFDDVKIYYDNGQVEVSKLLSIVFNALLPNPIFRKVMPADYKLFQVADFVCTMKLLQLKIENNQFSKSEMNFFGSQRDLKQNYLNALKKKEWK